MSYKSGSKPVVVGNIVYFHFEGKLGAKEQTVPAIVTNYNDDDTVNLTVFNDSLANTFEKNVKEGTGVGQWCWPAQEPEPEPEPAKASE